MNKFYKVSFWVLLLMVIAYGIFLIGNYQRKNEQNQNRETPKIKTEKKPSITQTITEKSEQPALEEDNKEIVIEEPIEEPSPTTIEIKVYKQGSLDIDPNKSADLDSGNLSNNESSDIKFLVDGANNLRGLNFLPKVKYYRWGVADISDGKTSCEKVQFNTAQEPKGSVISSDSVQAGENFCYITNSERYGMFKVLQNIKQAGKIRMEFTTWE